jgi:putative ABC transport system permease protein
MGNDLRYSLRLLRKNPGFAAIAILALALGTGANTAVFSVVNAVLLRPLPFPEPRQLVRLWDTFGTPGNLGPVSYPNFEDWRHWNGSFSGMAAFTGSTAVLTGAGDAMRLTGVAASANLFEVLGVQPAIGRRFRPEEDRPHANDGYDSIILSDRLWRERFAGDQAILGRVLTLDAAPFVVVGVAPAGLDMHAGPADPDFWMTAATLAQPAAHMARAVTEQRGMSFLDTIGRLRPGVTVAQAQADMDRVAGLSMSAHPADNPREGVFVKDLQSAAAGDVRPTLLLLLGAAGVVFVIACADVGGLILARATRRQREMVVRAAVGAGRWRLTRQLLAESAVLAVLGGAAGLWIATALSTLLAKVLGLATLAAPLDLRVFGFAFAAAAVAAVIFSLAPALHLAASDLIRGLRESGIATSDTRRQKRMHAVLATAQIALATALLSASGLLTASMWRLQRVELGFQPERVLTFPVTLPAARYPQARRAAFFEELGARLESLPGARAVAASSQLPLSGGVSRTVLAAVAGVVIPQEKRVGIAFASVTPGYFRTLGIAVRRGREFDRRDGAGAPAVVIVNEAAARRYFGDRDPLGQQVTPEMWNGSGSETQARTIVGIAGDVKLQGLDRAGVPTVYWPIAQIPSNPALHVSVQTAGDPAALIGGVREALRAMDRDLPLYNVRPMARDVERALERPRNTAALVGLLAAFALALTAVGLYGTIALSVARRTREIGIRMAIGAARRDILRGFLRDGLRMSVAGVAIGIPAAFGAASVLQGLLFGVVGPGWVIAGAAGVLLGVALLASWVPARRATRVDPLVALRWE